MATKINLWSDAQALAALRALRPAQLNSLRHNDARTVKTAMEGLLRAERLLARADARDADLVLVYEPSMDYPEDSTPNTRFERIGKDASGNIVWATDLDENPYAVREEPKGNPATSELMRAQAALLREAAVATSVKRILACVR